MKKTMFRMLFLLSLTTAMALFSGCHYDLDQTASFDILSKPVLLDTALLQTLPGGEFKLELEENCEIPAQVRALVKKLQDQITNQEIDLGAYGFLPFIKPKIEVRALHINEVDLNATKNTFTGINALSFEIKDSSQGKSIRLQSQEITPQQIPLRPVENMDWLAFLMSPDMECMETSLSFTGTPPEKPVSFTARAHVTVKVRILLF
ncbi:MAG TPA: hypothetical protein PLY90_11285 [Candidatus Hydrogenedentes bacterium]|jgi:hypothetical protein|nr:MAG: hypothetical protein BWY07_02236 [Candidatus Hydrogenedentes bacterium ADurb.Bin170]HNZ48038.1 hypothetical protein [Candidatus Hydrogenedentota bacterium]HOD95328.1 hypothetical protein [Candidatus Hydrogenedentota bacterium]HOM47394.1 hypothetical protein [Candidatus Hydrogenedentota bacterium]HOR50783.1 hypothetical protein [Candidatus Hydrogenedentota bacterium]